MQFDSKATAHRHEATPRCCQQKCKRDAAHHQSMSAARSNSEHCTPQLSRGESNDGSNGTRIVGFQIYNSYVAATTAMRFLGVSKAQKTCGTQAADHELESKAPPLASFCTRYKLSGSVLAPARPLVQPRL
jgi:hypothetical protein